MKTKPICSLVLACVLAILAPQVRADHAAEQALLAASGVVAANARHRIEQIDRLAGELAQSGLPADERLRVEMIHQFLHRRVLGGSYLASASDVGTALDGGPFNCVGATILLRMLCERNGLAATAMAVRGHVWCRVTLDDGQAIDIESTCRDWFDLMRKYRGLPTSQVSEAMAGHRRRVIAGRSLGNAELLAVLHFNRGVSLLEQGRLAAAALANLRAIRHDPQCRPAWENLRAARLNLPRSENSPAALYDQLLLWSIDAAVRHGQVELAGP